MEILKNLNSEQREAVISLNGPVLIIAGAGAGKTRVITHRIAYLISQNIAPQNILAVTFTNKAANEMRERMMHLLAQNDTTTKTTNPYIGTFHSLGVRILRESGKHIDIPRNFSILDEGDALKLVKEALTELNLDPKQWQPKKMKNLISKQKNLLNDLDKFSIRIIHLFSFQKTGIYAGRIWYTTGHTDAHPLYRQKIGRRGIPPFDAFRNLKNSQHHRPDTTVLLQIGSVLHCGSMGHLRRQESRC